MSLADRIDAEVRTIGGVPWQPWLNPFWRFNIGGPVHPTQQVQGVDKTLGLSAVYACVRIISDLVSTLPIVVYRTLPDGTAQRTSGSQLLDNPSVLGTVCDWLYVCMTSVLLWGNAWGYITSRTGVPGPDGLALPASVEWLPPDRMNVQDDEMQPWNPMRTKFYFDGHEVHREELVHIRAFPIPGRTQGISPMRAFATLISQGLGALDYSHDWYHNGGFPPGTFCNTAEEVDANQAKEIRQRLTDTLRMHQPLVYGRDWEYKPITIPPQEAAFVESMQLNATQVASVYGLPPERVGGKRGDSLTYSTEQQEVLAIITDTLRPWLIRLEQAFNRLIPSTQYCKFDVDQLLKTDLKTRYEIQQIQRQAGLRTTDELRRTDDMPPLAGGQGADSMPLGVLERMAATTRAIPRSMLNSVVLEQELAAELLLKLQQQGVVQPQTGPDGEPKAPVATTPEMYLGRQITLSRNWADFETALPPSTAEMPEPADEAQLEQARNKAREFVFEACRQGLMYVQERESTLTRIVAARSRDELYGFMLEVRRRTEAAARALTMQTDAPAGDSATPFGPAHLRATNSDRDRAHSWISRAHTAGALADNERDERLAKVPQARIKGALGELVRDLPSEAELNNELKKLANTPDNSRADGTPQELFGPLALARLQELQLRWGDSELAGVSRNGNGRH